jgi:hypothetical protein
LESVAVKIAQEAGVEIQQLQHQNENVTIFDTNLFHTANAEFVRKQGRQAPKTPKTPKTPKPSQTLKDL